MNTKLSLPRVPVAMAAAALVFSAGAAGRADEVVEVRTPAPVRTEVVEVQVPAPETDVVEVQVAPQRVVEVVEVEVPVGEIRHFNGTVVRRGGTTTPVYYGIISEEGGMYVPTNLPPAYRRDGVEVIVTGMPTGEFTRFGWGEPLRIYDIAAARTIVLVD